MKSRMVSKNGFIYAIVISLFVRLLTVCDAFENVGEKKEKEEEEFQLPATLSTEEFDLAIQSSLVIIDFYSPYCSHCKLLQPIWKETVQEFTTLDEYKEFSDKLSFYQVNCVEMGDLCGRERIAYYPSLKLYNSSGFVKDYPDDAKRNKENFLKFAKQEVQEIYQLADQPDTEKENIEKVYTTKYLDQMDLVSIISGVPASSNDDSEPLDLKAPWMVSFWPASDFNPEDKSGDSTQKMESIFKDCPTCFYAYENWKVAANKVHADGIRTGTFNCYSKDPENDLNEKICQELGIMDSLSEPALMMILPQKKYHNVFKFSVDQGESGGGNKKTFNINEIVDFSSRIVHNAKIPDINTVQLKKFTNPSVNEKLAKNMEDEKVYVVFNYEKNTLAQEELDLLDNLIEPLTEIPHLYFYKNAQDLSAYSEEMVEYLYSSINYNKSEPLKSIDRDVFHNTILSQQPTFYIFKENSLIPNVLRVFSTIELRDMGLVMDWIRQNSLPHINELKQSNAERIFQFDKELYSQVSVLLIDSQVEQSRDFLNNYRLASFDYEMLRWTKNYDILEALRTEKATKIATLKEQSSSGNRKKMFHEMKKELYLDIDKRCVFTYVDLSKNKDLSKYGINCPNSASYKAGDIIVIDNSTPTIKVYEKDPFGQKLSSDSPFYLKELLSSLNLDKSVKIKPSFKLSESALLRGYKNLTNSGSFGIFHAFTVICITLFGTLVCMATVLHYKKPRIVFTALVKLRRRLRHSRKSQKDVNLGILGAKDSKLME